MGRMEDQVEAGMLLEEERREDGFAPARATERRVPKGAAAAAGAGLLAAGLLLVGHARGSRPRGSEFELHAPLLLAVEDDAGGSCSKADEDIDYVFQGAWYSRVDNIGDQDTCCDLCGKEPRCKAWTWVRDAKLPTGNPGQCWLKGGFMKGKADKAGVVSGMSPMGVVVTEGEDEMACAVRGQNCLKSQCCKDPGLQCYAKDQWWAQCQESCAAGPNPLDQASNLPWTCTALGDRAPGKVVTCAKDAEDCRASKCCALGGMQCYEKNASYAQCKIGCKPGPDLTASDWAPWTCKEFGTRQQTVAPWTKQQCSQPGADCRQSQCCAVAGQQCYKMNEFWGECKEQCKPGQTMYPGGPTWACEQMGTRTPVDAAESATKVVGKWVEQRCAGVWGNCADVGCCQAVGKTCFAKNESYANCRDTCTGLDEKTNETWSCNKLGPASWGLATKGYPSLFCVTLYMPSRYEGPLLKSHLDADAGIFACDGFDVFAAEPDMLGVTKDGVKVEALQIPKIEVGVSQDGTAGNAKLFMAFWDKVIATGRFRNYDFTIKVDPDAVIVPWRIRDHMKGHLGSNAYIVNCNKFPGSPNFPMMFGAVEIFSNQAMTAYAYGSWKCGMQLPWHAWGEDYYMTHCLDFLGVGRINDFGTLGDAYCTGANCKDTYVAAFHPFKDPDKWSQCWNDAMS